MTHEQYINEFGNRWNIYSPLALLFDAVPFLLLMRYLIPSILTVVVPYSGTFIKAPPLIGKWEQSGEHIEVIVENCKDVESRPIVKGLWLGVELLTDKAIWVG